MKRSIAIVLVLTMILTTGLLRVPASAMGESGATATGWGTTFYVSRSGDLWGYGKNAEDLLPGGGTYVSEPMKLASDVKSVCANRYAVMVIKRDLSLWYWGRLPGIGTAAQPTKLTDDVVSMALDSGNNQTVLIAKSDGSLHVLDGDTDKAFQQVPHADKVKFVAVGGYNRFFINDRDELWGWCTNMNGSTSLGVGHTDPVTSPVKILDGVQSVAADNSNTLIVRSDASLWMCGNGDQGLFYNGTTEVEGPVLTPVRIMDNVRQAAAYDSAFAVVKQDNTLWIWGDNVNSALGASHLSKPVQWTTDIAGFTYGYQHFAAIKTDNSLWTGGRKDGVYQATLTTGNPLRLTASDLVDVPSTWALAEVREAEWRKLVPPELQSDYVKSVSRSEFCTLAIICIEQAREMPIEAYLAAQGIAMPTASPFGDIAQLSAEARKDILAAYALGIVNGTTPTTFEPDRLVNREQGAKMMTAAAEALGKDTAATYPVFHDEGKISGWAKPFIGYVHKMGIMTGSNGNFDPAGGYQRQQAYMTMLRLYKLVTGVE